MQVSLKKLPESRAELTITLPWSEWEGELAHAAEEMGKNVKLPGFRPGKVPRDVIEQRFGREAVLAEAAEHAVSHSYPKALVEAKLEGLGHPAVRLERFKEGEELVYIAETDVYPAVTLGEWRKAVKKVNAAHADDQVVVSAEAVESELRKLAEMRAPLIAVNRAAAEGDTALVDFTVEQDGAIIEGGKSENHPLQLGSGTFIPGFEEEIVGMQAGEEKAFTLTFPTDYHAKHLAGKEAQFTVKLRTVQERQLPELDDEFAKSVGHFETLAALRENIESGMREEEKAKKKEAHRTEILDALVASAELEYPASLVSQEEDRMLREFASQAQMMGMDLNSYLERLGKSEADVKREWQPQAKKRLAAQLVLEAVAKAEDIQVDNEEIESEMNKTIQYYKNVKDAEKELDLSRLYTAVREQLQNRKALEHLESVK